MVLFKSPADLKQKKIFSQKIFLKEQTKVMIIYNKETDKQHGYTVVDNSPSTSKDSHCDRYFHQHTKNPMSCDDDND